MNTPSHTEIFNVHLYMRHLRYSTSSNALYSCAYLYEHFIMWHHVLTMLQADTHTHMHSHLFLVNTVICVQSLTHMLLYVYKPIPENIYHLVLMHFCTPAHCQLCSKKQTSSFSRSKCRHSRSTTHSRVSTHSHTHTCTHGYSLMH